MVTLLYVSSKEGKKRPETVLSRRRWGVQFALKLVVVVIRAISSRANMRLNLSASAYSKRSAQAADLNFTIYQ